MALDLNVFSQIMDALDEGRNAEFGQLFMIESQPAMEKRLSRLPTVRLANVINSRPTDLGAGERGPKCGAVLAPI